MRASYLCTQPVCEKSPEKMGVKNLFLVAFFLLGFVQSEPNDDKKALLKFIKTLPHSHLLNWKENSPACSNWTGVVCNHDESRIVELRLPAIGFHGRIPPETLGRLSALQILSLRSNNLSGPFPHELSKLRNLTELYLQSNTFSGFLPLDVSVWKDLSVLDLSDNGFTGTIPSSFANLTRLTNLDLSNNSLSGEIPDLNLPTLQVLNLSNNELTGFLPRSLQRFPERSFAGNNLSAEIPSPPPDPIIPATAQSLKKHKKLGKVAIISIITGGCILGFVTAMALVIVCYSKSKGGNGDDPAVPRKKEGFAKKEVSGRQDGNGKLVFFEGRHLAFDLEDLLRASAEVLGKGTFGTAYKAALEDSNTVVVKRLKDVSVATRDFEQQMEIVGNIRHENIAPLRAYFCSKDEKLMVYDYYSQGSVSAMLHAKRREDRTHFDWETRLRIAIGSARGISHIHAQNNGKLVHGNIKASNVFLNPEQYGCVSDLGLGTLIGPTAPPVMRTVGYRAPELTDARRVSQASDIYSFGVFLLELLTGKSPIHVTGGDEVIHLVRWVNSVVREEWTAEVFDLELLRYPNIEEEMVEMLQLGLACAARMPEQRPKMVDVLKRLEEIRRHDRTSPDDRSEGSTPALTPTGAGPTYIPR